MASAAAVPLRRAGPAVAAEHCGQRGPQHTPRGRASCPPRSPGDRGPPPSDVISCRFLAGLSEAETAAVLGCRPGTVKSRLSRALVALRTHLVAPGTNAFEEGAIRG